MKNIQTLADKTAIGLSIICTTHCLLFPLMVLLLPATMAWRLEEKAFHFWMLASVIPISLLALTMGCRKHSNYSVLILGTLGLMVLIATVLLGHDSLSETGEKTLTVLGASLIAMGHLLNHRLCQHSDCACHA